MHTLAAIRFRPLLSLVALCLLVLTLASGAVQAQTRPGAVTNLVLEPGVQKIDVSWDKEATADADGYRIEWKLATEGDNTYGDPRRETNSATDLDYTITGLTACTKYTVRVQARKAGTMGSEDHAVAEARVLVSPGSDSVLCDRAALTEIYFALDGPNWFFPFGGHRQDLVEWLRDDRDLHRWDGVSTTPEDSTGRVTDLRVDANNVKGTIPGSPWAAFTELKGIRIFRKGGLRGPLPAGLGSIPKLSRLQISNNGNLDGPIPPELGNLSELQLLFLHDNKLSGSIPTELGSLSMLEQLELQNNELTGPIPAELGSLSNLEELFLNGNQLTGTIPAELGSLPNLEELFLNDNQLSGPIPMELDALADTLGTNIIEGDLGLKLAGNDGLTGCVPANLWKVPNDLDELGLPACEEADHRAALTALYNATGGTAWTTSTNWNSDTPISTWHGVTTNAMGQVTALDLSNNNLAGELPSELANLVGTLTEISLDGNSGLTGCVPYVLGDVETNDYAAAGLSICDEPPGSMADRAVLTAIYNATGGTNWAMATNWNNNDKSLGTWHGVTTDANGRVTVLNLDANMLTGPIPSGLGDLVELKTLVLSGNQLTGPIPSELGDLADTLTMLDLGGNSGLTGCLLYSLRNAATTFESRAGLPLCSPTMGQVIVEAIPGGTAIYSVGMAQVTINAMGWDVMDSRAEFGFPDSLDADLTLTLGPVPDDQQLPDEGEFMLGGEDARTLVDITVTRGSVPGGGVEVCLPIIDALSQEAGNQEIVLLHYNGMAWEEAGSSRRNGVVCASGVTTFSPFAVGYKVTPVQSRDVAMVLAAIARTLASDAVEMVTDRANTPAATGGHMTLGGKTLQLGEEADKWSQVIDTELNFDSQPFHTMEIDWPSDLDRQESTRTATDLSVKDLLYHSAFELPLNNTDGQGTTAWTLWGRGSASGFDGSPESNFDMDGTLYSGYIGIDYRPQATTLLGMAISHTTGDVDYERTGDNAGAADIDIDLTRLLPYVHWQASPGLDLWVLAGIGDGEMKFKPEGDDERITTDLSSYLGAVGFTQALTTWEGIDLSAKADAFMTTLRSSGDDELPELRARGRANRVRVQLEGQSQWDVDADTHISPRLAIGGRWDNGTAEEGVGVEISGGLSYIQTAVGLKIDAQGRYLISHNESDFEDWGASLNIQMDPGTSGSGAYLSIAPVWGQASSEVEQLWSDEDVLESISSDSSLPGWRPQQLDIGLGYRLSVGDRRITPYSGLSLNGDNSRYTLGSRWEVALSGSMLNMSIEGSRQRHADKDDESDITARFEWKW